MRLRQLNKPLSNILFLGFLSILSSNAIAQSNDTIYKCVDTHGKISYLNISERKGRCEKTDLSDPNKMMVVENHTRKRVNHTPQQIANANSRSMQMLEENKLNHDQYLRDQKRVLILKKELTNEEEQLKTVVAMIRNAKDDKEQKLQLENMKANHKRNITSLKKEIRAKSRTKKPILPRNNTTQAKISFPFIVNPELLPTTLPQS